jgi:hypothetical protein
MADSQKGFLSYFTDAKYNIVSFTWGGVSDSNLVSAAAGNLSMSTDYCLGTDSSLSLKIMDNQYGGGVSTGFDASVTTLNTLGAQVTIEYKPKIIGEDFRKLVAKYVNYAVKHEATCGSFYRYTNSGVMSAFDTLTLQAPANKTFSTSSPPKYQNFVKILGQLEAAAGITLGVINSSVVLGTSSKSVGCGVTSGVISLAPVAALTLYNVIAQFLITRNATKAKNSGDSVQGMDADIIVIATNNAEFDSNLGIDIKSQESKLILDNDAQNGGYVLIEANNTVNVKIPNSEINISNNQIELKNTDKTITVNQNSIKFKQNACTINLTDKECEFTNGLKTTIKSDLVTMGPTTINNGKLKFGP